MIIVENFPSQQNGDKKIRETIVFPNFQIFKIQTHNIKPLVPQTEKL